ncbi:unnamed protein product [Peronospora destructor]|uniref:Peptidase A2 domain-containing protein n=1 Tax=Peronospora destructor TaxID=86335 RepID=A0AAV0VGT1_9STRA|nr:unnamed protein product [Peronospora destructor]
MELNLAPGESRGYWKYYAPGKWFKQAKAAGKINNEKATLLFDSGAEVSIIDTTFARKVGCVIDESQRQECIGIGENSYMTIGRTKIKVTLAGSLVYYFDVWVGDQSGQEAILGMDFMVPAGIRLDLADGTLTLPDEVQILLSGRRPLYGGKIHMINADDQYVMIPVGDSAEVKISLGSSNAKLWVTRGPTWVPTVTSGPGRKKYLQLTNISDRDVSLPQGVQLGMWMPADMVPRTPGYVSVGSRRYNEWQTLAYEVTVDRRKEPPEEITGPLVDHPTYSTPTKIMTRPEQETTIKPTVSTISAVPLASAESIMNVSPLQEANAENGSRQNIPENDPDIPVVGATPEFAVMEEIADNSAKIAADAEEITSGEVFPSIKLEDATSEPHFFPK